jgi:hypothetical protein
MAGIALRDSSDGELITFGVSRSGVGTLLLRLQRWTSPTSWFGTLLDLSGSRYLTWLRVNVTSTTITFYASDDGENWINVGTETISAYIDAVNQVGIIARGNSNASPVMAVGVSYFGTTAPPVT